MVQDKMGKYLSLVIVIFGGIIWSEGSQLNSNDVCVTFENCSCSKDTIQYSIQCPPLKPDVIIQLLPHEYKVEIECNNNTDYHLDILNGVHINIKSLVINSCLIPMFKFKLLAEKLNASSLRQLALEGCVFGNNSLHIDTTFFDSFFSLESLTLKGIHFEGDLFKNLHNLSYLYLEENNWTEIGYIFENNPNLLELHLSQNNIQNLPDNGLSKLINLQQLHLWGNALTKITNKYFTGLRNLRNLELSRNSIYYIEESAFSELFELRALNLKDNKLGFIGSDTFKNNPNIQNIVLDDNPNLKLSNQVFTNLSKLIYLSLRNNFIADIPKYLFKDLKNLHILYLSNNKLKYLSDEVFSSLKNLTNLSLEGNYLTNITKSTFNKLTNLTYLNLKNNRISYIEQSAFLYQKKLIELDLSYNQWAGESFIFYSFVKLKKLSLSHNKISVFPNVDRILNLKELDISHNYLKTVDVISLLIATNHKIKINLNYNQISEINFKDAEEVVRKNSKNNEQTEINISNNPLICDCRNFELVQYFKGKMNSIKKFVNFIVDDVTCYAPEQLRYINIQDLKLEEINCEINYKHCPSSCKCFKRSFDLALIIDCAFKNLTQIPILNIQDKRIEMNLTGNLLEIGPNINHGYQNVNNLFLSNNKIKIFDWCPPYIEDLRLDNNNLTQLSSNILKTFNGSEKFSKLTLANNPWSCGCSSLELQNFIKTHYNKTKINSVLCVNDNIPLVDKKDICKSKLAIVAQLVIPLLVIFFITAILTTLYIHYKQEIMVWLFSKNYCLWFITEQELDKDKKYDIFLSFSHKDEDFVAENLIPALEKSFKVCIHSRDFIVGELINDQIASAVFNSRRTLVVLSNNFLDSAWGRFEFLLAHKQSIEENRPRVIVIKLDDLNVDKITDEYKAYFKTNTYLEWGDRWFWKKLLYALPHSVKTVTNNNQKHANMMMKIDDKFCVTSQAILHPGINSGNSPNNVLKQQPLKISLSHDLKPLQFEVPLIKNE